MKRLFLFIILIALYGLLFGKESSLQSAEIKHIGSTPVLFTNISIPLPDNHKAVDNFLKTDFMSYLHVTDLVKSVKFKGVEIDGTFIHKYRYSYKGWPVEGVYTSISMKNGSIYRIANSMSNFTVDLSNIVKEEQAVTVALKKHSKFSVKQLPKYHAEKVIIKVRESFIPAYKIRFMPIALYDTRHYYVHAKTGAFIKGGSSTFFADADLADEQVEEPAVPLDEANVYLFNPVKTPDTIVVELPWVAPHDDVDLEEAQRGFLLTNKDPNSIRKIKAYNCPDKGEKINLQEVAGFPLEIPLCSPTPLANKVANGSFLYNDCADQETHEYDSESMTEERVDMCSEISLYYHASKVYKYMRSLKTDFQYLINNNEEKPLNVIANFQMPDMSDMNSLLSGEAGLAAMDNAFFSADNPMFAQFLGQFGVTGDLLVFGQGTKADFGLDGDVIYHEFGHATIYSTGLNSGGFADKYGLNNEPGSLHEGIADTFSFFMTDDICTGEYASKGIVDMAESMGGVVDMDSYEEDGKKYWCMRIATNEYLAQENFIGEVHWDGQPILAANWEIYSLAKENKVGATLEEQRDNFVKLILKTLYGLGTAEASVKLWAETMMTEVKNDDNFKAYETEIKKILTDRNFYEEVRARALTDDGIKQIHAAAGEGNQQMGGSGSPIVIEEDGTTYHIAPAYLQMYVDIPEKIDGNAIRISASVSSGQGGSMGGFGGGGSPEFKMYVRKGDAITYETGDSSYYEPTTQGVYDELAGTWTIPEIEPGNRYYFHFVNYGAADGVLNNISYSFVEYVEETDEDLDAETVEEDVTDEEGDTETPDTTIDNTKKKSSSGCGCNLIF